MLEINRQNEIYQSSKYHMILTIPLTIFFRRWPRAIRRVVACARFKHLKALEVHSTKSNIHFMCTITHTLDRDFNVKNLFLFISIGFGVS